MWCRACLSTRPWSRSVVASRTGAQLWRWWVTAPWLPPACRRRQPCYRHPAGCSSPRSSHCDKSRSTTVPPAPPSHLWREKERESERKRGVDGGKGAMEGVKARERWGMDGIVKAILYEDNEWVFWRGNRWQRGRLWKEGDNVMMAVGQGIYLGEGHREVERTGREK